MEVKEDGIKLEIKNYLFYRNENISVVVCVM